MASDLYLGNIGSSTMINALGALGNGASGTSGAIQLWAGTQPATANTNTSGSNYLLASVAFSTTAFGSAANSTLTANPLTATSAVSSGICEWYRWITSSGTGSVGVLDGSVSTAAADLNFNTNNFAQGASVSITSFVIILPQQ